MKKVLLVISALAIAVATVPMFAAFEAHVINVTAHIENALWVNPEPLEFGTVFPQEYLDQYIFLTFSDSFNGQDRVNAVEYMIKQKPKPRPEFEERIGVAEARKWCHDNEPSNADNQNDSYYDDCYPSLCPYLSKHPDGWPEPNDTEVLAFHNPDDIARGLIQKSVVPVDASDMWLIDLAVPCFAGHCAQDWGTFVTDINPDADPAEFILHPDMEHEVFGCDLWFEVTNIY